MTKVSNEEILQALSKVIDPEIGRPITDLGMVGEVSCDDNGVVNVQVKLTVAACPLKEKIGADVRSEVGALDGVSDVQVEMGAMTDEERAALREKLSGPQREIVFNKPGSLTRVYCITSGKGGVGKSSMTANLACALAAEGLKVGVVDADIYGFSIPRMLGVAEIPTVIDNMIIPPVTAAEDTGVGGIKVISIGMFVPDGQPVIWRGPMLHRALSQFLADTYWGDLDVLLLDLPPGTGDVAISISQLLPSSEIIVVTTPQVAAAEVAERAGTISSQTEQRVVGVIENMSYLPQSDGSRLEIFGSGGGAQVSERLGASLAYEVPLLGQVPLDISLREGSDAGKPVVAAKPDSAAAVAIRGISHELAHRSRGLAGRNLGVTPL